ncbi:Non-reducing end alpha-L-arabinofuranosidase [Paramyrothecium foliicola]|nr:Non-reducing end alpha-L-arabinofuranosidase [Paramyrothecium foliicola]
MWSLFATLWLASSISRAALAINNPILPGFNPDPAILRVGEDYYIAVSSLEYFPGIPIYTSKDLANWTLVSHALNTPDLLQLYGTPTAAGAWAPSLSHFDGKFWLTATTRWTYDPIARVWPRVWYISSTDLKTWSDVVWGEPWGIDPELFHDPVSKKVYLNLMAPNNNQDRLWGISQCQISLESGNCIGPYRSLWNGTLPHTNQARPEGPKTTYKDGWYYLLIAEGGTDELHRASVARSRVPEGPYESNPKNPLMYNGAWGFNNLTVQSTGHATMVDTPDGKWFAAFLARRNVKGRSPLGRETFLATVTWEDGWPVFNNGNPILLSEQVGPKSTQNSSTPASVVETFSNCRELRPDWYQLRTPYTKTYDLVKTGLILRPNVFSLSDRDTPSALLRKQKSLNMTFSAELLGFNGILGPRNEVGISAYLSEFQHQDIGVRGCVNATGMCIFTRLWKNQTSEYQQLPLDDPLKLEDGLVLHVRATPLTYQLGYSVKRQNKISYIAELDSGWQAFGPPGWFVFGGSSFALFATGLGEPWPHDAPKVGFKRVTETYFEENIPDYDVWD